MKMNENEQDIEEKFAFNDSAITNTTLDHWMFLGQYCLYLVMSGLYVYNWQILQ